jgi:hypothetical protein
MSVVLSNERCSVSVANPLGMESYFAEDLQPLDKCLEDVERGDVCTSE